MTRIYGWGVERDGCRWYRLTLPLTELGRRGHEVTVSQRIAVGVHAEAFEQADTVVGQRVNDHGASRWWWMLALRDHPRYRQHLHDGPGSNGPLMEVLRRIEGQRKRLVFELDDDLLHLDPGNPGHKWNMDPERRENLVTNLALADAVTVSTPALAQVVSPHVRGELHVIPNAVPPSLLEVEPPRREDGTVTVGWAGSTTHGQDWQVMDTELVRFFRRTRRAELHVIGGMGRDWTRLPEHRVRTTAWCRDVWDYYRAVDFHIGLAPLADTPFNRAKSAVKALEYGALGIPVIASDVEPYREFVRHGETGYLVRRPEEWGRYLRELTHDTDARVEMGRNARKYAADHTTETTGDAWEAVLCP